MAARWSARILVAGALAVAGGAEFAALSGCAREEQPEDAATAEAPATEGPSAKETEDAAQAIETFIAAARTREAELVARRLVERTPRGSATAARASELASRAYFARVELAGRELSPPERTQLLADAAEHAERAARASTNDAVRLRFAALLRARNGDAATARELYDLALAAAPDDLQTLLPAASVAIAEKDLARARTLIDRHAALAPDAAWSSGLASSLALAEGRGADAVREAREALRRDGDTLEFRMLLARALRATQAPEEAARMLSALDEPARAKPAIAEQLALALSELGDLAGAARAWSLSRAANPADPFVRAETAIALHRAGDTAGAAAELAELRAIPGAGTDAARAEAAIRGAAEPR